MQTFIYVYMYTRILIVISKSNNFMIIIILVTLCLKVVGEYGLVLNISIESKFYFHKQKCSIENNKFYSLKLSFFFLCPLIRPVDVKFLNGKNIPQPKWTTLASKDLVSFLWISTNIKFRLCSWDCVNIGCLSDFCVPFYVSSFFCQSNSPKLRLLPYIRNI